MIISEKAARELNKYTTKLVKRQPVWLRTLFVEEKIVFSLDDDGTLTLAVHPELNKGTAEHACRLIAKYMAAHPNKMLSETKVM